MPALRPEPVRATPVLWALLFGNFVIGAGVMVVAGTLNELSGSLGTDVATTGLLIAAAAAAMCVCAPLFAAFVAGWDRRRLLALAMLWWGISLLASTLATRFELLLPLRVLSVISPAIFTPQAAACVGLLVPAERRGKAITFIFLGWSLASVLGLPLSAWIGGHFGWRAAFATVGVLALASAAWVWRAMPDGVRPPRLSGGDWQRTFRSTPLMLGIAVTVTSAAGQFVLMSYLAPYFHAHLGASPNELSLLFFVFGTCGVLGNMLLSRYIDRLGAPRAVMWSLLAISATMLLWPLADAMALALLVVVPWGLGCFAANSGQQARLVGMAPALAPASVALNSSAIYAGQAIGAAGGGWLIAHVGMGHLHQAALAALVLSIGLSALTGRASAASSNAA